VIVPTLFCFSLLHSSTAQRSTRNCPWKSLAPPFYFSLSFILPLYISTIVTLCIPPLAPNKLLSLVKKSIARLQRTGISTPNGNQQPASTHFTRPNLNLHSFQPTSLCNSSVSLQVPNSWALAHARLVARGPRHVKPEPENRRRGREGRSTCFAVLVAWPRVYSSEWAPQSRTSNSTRLIPLASTTLPSISSTPQAQHLELLSSNNPKIPLLWTLTLYLFSLISVKTHSSPIVTPCLFPINLCCV
jgi:hypothetical protein